MLRMSRHEKLMQLPVSKYYIAVLNDARKLELRRPRGLRFLLSVTAKESRKI
jgi:hypothetical protein